MLSCHPPRCQQLLYRASPGRRCTISGSKGIYRENSGSNLSLTLCFGPKLWLSLEFRCCEPFGMLMGDAERGVLGWAAGRAWGGSTLSGGGHLGLILCSLSLVQGVILGFVSPWDKPGQTGPRELGLMEACKHILVDTCVVSSPL